MLVSTVDESVIIEDLGDLELSHPIEDFDLSELFHDELLWNSSDLQKAVLANKLTVKTKTGSTVSNLTTVWEVSTTSSETVGTLISINFIVKEALNSKDFVYINSNNEGYKSGLPGRPARGYVKESYDIDDVGVLYIDGILPDLNVSIGSIYYLDNIIAGNYTTAYPSETSQHIYQVLGLGVNGGLLVNIQKEKYYE